MTDPESLLARAADVRRLARGLVFDSHLAGDVAQDVLLVALERAPRDGGQLGSWLAALVRNVARKAWRSDSRRVQREERAARPESGVPSPAEILEREDLRRALVERVLALEPPLSEALVLRYLEELPPRAIARRLGLPVETVRTRIQRGLALLRARLDREKSGDRAAWALALVRGLNVTAGPAEVCGALAGAALGGAMAMSLGKTALAAGGVLVVVLGALRMRGERAGAEELAPVEGDAVELVDAGAPVELAGGVGVPDAARAVIAPALAAPVEPAPLVVDPAFGTVLLRVAWHDGTPAADVAATVHASGAEDFYADAFEVRTGLDGTVLIEQVPPGHVSAYLDRGTDPDGVEVSAGELVELAFVVARGYDVAGRVVELDGMPVEGADILLTTMGAAATSFHRVARSDAEGRFLVRSIDGLGWLAARAPLHAPTASYALLSGAGATLEVQLTLPASGGALEGQVLDASGTPVAGALVIAGEESAFARALVPEGVQAMTTPGACVTAGEDGGFRADGLPTGEQPVLVRARGFAPWRGAVTIDAGGVASLAITLLQEASATGMVRTPDGLPASGVTVRTLDDGFLGRTTRTAADGTFALRGLPTGELQILAESDGVGSAHTTLFGVPGTSLTWNPTLDAGRVIRGRILFAGNMADLGVRCEMDQAPFLIDARPAADGTFELAGLADAPHRIKVIARSCWIFPLVIRTEVQPGSEELELTVDPAQLPSVRLVGRLTDAQGNGRAGVTVSSSWVSAPDVHNGALVTTDEYGGFDVGPYPPGTWSIFVRGGEVGSLKLGPVELAPGQTHDFGDVVVE